jgi:hypothetical protein
MPTQYVIVASIGVKGLFYTPPHGRRHFAAYLLLPGGSAAAWLRLTAE